MNGCDFRKALKKPYKTEGSPGADPAAANHKSLLKYHGRMGLKRNNLIFIKVQKMKNKNYSLTLTALNSMKYFSAAFDKRVLEVKIECGISIDEPQLPPWENNFLPAKALWDTASSITHITKSLAMTLGLVSESELLNGTWKNIKPIVFILLPNNISIPIEVAIAQDCPGIDLIIGMNIINKGNFSVGGMNSHFQVLFGMPYPEKNQSDNMFSGALNPISTKTIIDEGVTLFEVVYDKIVDRVITDCKVSPYIGALKYNEKSKKSVKAIWDTGACHTLISRSLAKEIGLTSFGKHEMYSVDGLNSHSVYGCNLHLAGLDFSGPVSEMLDHSDFDIAIGMDLISQGLFYIENSDSKTTMQFTIHDNEAGLLSPDPENV